MSRKLVGTAFIITMLSILVKLSGFLRESIMARQFGATAQTDGYLLSFTFITLVIAMITHGFNNAFLPLYIKDSKKGNNSDRNASGAINNIFLIFVILSIIGYIFAEQIITTVFIKISEGAAVAAINSLEIFSLFLGAVALNGMFESFLQSKRIFAPPHISRLSQTLMSALFAILFDEQLGITSLAWGFVTGTVMGILIQGYVLWRSEFKWQPTLKIDRDFRREFIILLIPAMLNAIVGQVNLFVNKIFASGTTEGAVTYLNNSSLIVNIPGQIYSTTLAVIIFTLLSEQADEIKKFKNTVYSGLEMSLVFFVPISAGLFLVGEQAISLIYEGGAFTSQDTHNTFLAMIMYLPLIITQGMQYIIAKAMYALGKTSTILKISVTTIILNVILNSIFVKLLGYLGLALSTSLVSFYYFSLCTISLYKQFEKGEFRKVVYLAFRVLFATLIMFIPIFALQQTTGISSLSSIIQLVIIVPMGVILYILGTYLVNRPSLNNFINLLKR